MNKKSYLFINNPISGGGKNNFLKVFKGLKNQFPTHKIISTTHLGHAKKLATQYKKEYDVIVAVGGDGTINEISSALVNSNTALGIIPQGSGNGFANHLHIPKNTIQAINRLKTGSEKRIDAISINNCMAFNVAGVGFDGHISKLFNQSIKRGFWSYLQLTLKEFIDYKEFDYQIKNEKNLIAGKAFIIAIANTSQYGNNFKIAPNAKLDDGTINIIILQKPVLWKLPYLALRSYWGLPIGKEIITKSLSIVHPNQAMHIDGEAIAFDTEHLAIKIKENSLMVIS